MWVLGFLPKHLERLKSFLTNCIPTQKGLYPLKFASSCDGHSSDISAATFLISLAAAAFFRHQQRAAALLFYFCQENGSASALQRSILSK